MVSDACGWQRTYGRELLGGGSHQRSCATFFCRITSMTSNSILCSLTPDASTKKRLSSPTR
nr:MAG TPA_asm: hypothetical protein [Caudoviricetes sp.]